MSPKPHWTQTPEGRAKMSDAQKKMWASRRAKERNQAVAKIGKAAARLQAVREEQAERSSPTIVVHGWSITVVGNQLRIERES